MSAPMHVESKRTWPEWLNRQFGISVGEQIANWSKTMTLEPIADHGQTIASPAGKVIGFFDSKAEFEAFAESARAAGYPPSTISSLYGEGGIHLLERLKENSFFFADSEDNVIQLSIRELRQGHYAAAIDVTDHHHAAQIASLAKPHGGHSFSYFGTWVSEQLSK
jgi:hypothetical protein